MATKPKTKQYRLTHNGITFAVKEYVRSKGLRIIVHTGGAVTITCPAGTPKFAVGNFITEKWDWIEGAVSRMKQKPDAPKQYITVFRSRGHELEFRPHSENRITGEITGQLILVKYPNTLEICSPQVQNIAYKAIVMALKKEAADYIPKRLRELALANNLCYRSLSITSTRTKWGTCSNRKEIRISCFVMILTDELIDFILLHELAHTVVMNHSEAFHIKVNSMLEHHNEKELEKKLKNYHIIKPK